MVPGLANRRAPGATQPRTTDNGQRTKGFTLIELLVVILIILIVSAVALPTVLPAISHRQVSEGARILQGALVGARDKAIHDNAPAGIRLLLDPAFAPHWLDPTNPNDAGLLKQFPGLLNTIDPRTILASNRVIPIDTAPEYSEGLVTITTTPPAAFLNVPYPGPGSGTYPTIFTDPTLIAYPGSNVLVIEESPFTPQANGSLLPNPPTNWFWNIRLGDKIQINQAGPWYTVVGPMTVAAVGGNSELFVNVGQPGTVSPLQRSNANGQYFPEFLFLVNGDDDNGNGLIDEGWNGKDDNGNGLIDELAEWGLNMGMPTGNYPNVAPEAEQWKGSISTAGVTNQVYTIQRRPAPAPNAREIALPSNVVIDLTTWNYPPGVPSAERSRLPINSYGGYVDVVVNPDGTLLPTTIFSSPSSFRLDGAFFHFWLAERSDLAAPDLSQTAAPFLPVPQGVAPQRFVSGQEIKGEYRLLTLFTRNGQISTNDNMQFDVVNIGTANYNASLPFLEAQQGIRGGP